MEAARKPGTIGNILLWIVQVFVALGFLAAAGMKFAGHEQMVRTFEKIGFGQWFRYATGAIETLGAILVLVPGKARIGSGLLICVMTGALVAHFTRLDLKSAGGAVLMLLLSLAIFFGRKRG